MSRIFVVLTAAGMGTRLGGAYPKALCPLGDAPLLWHALRRLPPCDGVALSANADYLDEFEQITSQALHHGEGEREMPALVVPGGASRQASVFAALRELAKIASPVTSGDWVMVHDAARPFTPPAVFERVVAALRDGSEAVIPAVPVVDTVKIVVPQSQPEVGREVVESTLDRTRLRAVQTPQGFHLDRLLELHERFASCGKQEADAFGDDAAMAEAAGMSVTVVPGSPESLKITTPFDLQVASLLARGRDAAGF